MLENDKTKLDYCEYDFGATELLLPGITLNVPNIHGTSNEFTEAYLAYFYSDNAPSQMRIIDDALRNIKDSREIFYLLSLATTSVHELRHFHELFGSPFGAKIMYLLLENALCTPLALLSLDSEPTIALPLSSWRGLSADEFKLLTSQYNNVDLSPKPPDSLGIMIETIEERFNKIHRMYTFSSNHWKTVLSTKHILETSAVSVQCHLINVIHSNKVTSFYKNILRNMDTTNTYHRINNEDDQLYCFAEMSPVVLNAILFYSLCADWWNEPQSALCYPSERLAFIVEALRDYGRIPKEKECIEFLDYCAKKIMAPTLKESLLKSAYMLSALSVEIKERYKQVFSSLRLNKSLQMYLTLIDQIVASHAYLIQAILADPLAFFDPNKYIERATEWLAAPRWYRNNCYFFYVGNPYLNLKEAHDAGDWLVPGFTTVSDDDKKYAFLLLSKYLTVGKEIMTPQTVYHFGIDNYANSVLWANQTAFHVDQMYALRFLKDKLPNKRIVLLRNG
ncbi:MAG: hypothetical protein C0410_15465 [Anaerolinea sp.]|nr:hypothetical protein [Anaerolinea sp.]